MNAIDIDVCDESVRQLVLSLPTDPDGTQLRHNGKTLFRVIPVFPTEFTADLSWTDEMNARRCLLVDRDVRGTLTADEALELEELQE